MSETRRGGTLADQITALILALLESDTESDDFWAAEAAILDRGESNE